MDFFERQIFVQRICSAKLYTSIHYQNSSIGVIFHDPDLDIRNESNYIYKIYYDQLKEDNHLTLEESYEILKKDGRWSDAMSQENVKLEEDIKYLSQELNKNAFRKVAQRALKESIDKKRERLNELWHIKNQLLTSTIEYLANLKKQKFIISKTLYFSEEDDKRLLQNQNFLNIAAIVYNNSAIQESVIRILARSDPWRLQWSLSKDTGTPLFPCAINITDLQYSLVLWSKIYDFAYESSNKPSDSVIEEDSLFDGWYQNEIKVRQSESNKDSYGAGEEVFIISDKEGAKEVFELNNIANRMKIGERQKFIDENKEVKHEALPDVKAEIQMQSNRVASKG